MILFEFEGKELLAKEGIKVPTSNLFSNSLEDFHPSFPSVAKAQVLSGKRAQAGGIKIVNNQTELQQVLSLLLGKVINKEKVETVLVEEKVDFDKEYYVSLTYDTQYRGIVLTLSASGGSGIEERGAQKYSVDFLNLEKSLKDVKTDLPKELLTKIIQIFLDQDCVLLEINPLVHTKNNEWVVLDAKIKLDASALKRHEDWQYPPRGVPGYTPTSNEINAKKIDEEDYRGTAGSAYFDLAGDIAVLSSGGGVSLTAMDALTSFGAKAANFTEYSGNPPKEKVAKLTRIVLDKPNINGLWVIGTVAANFTDIYETLSGLLEGLREAEKEIGKKFTFPIVIRRGGPREEEAFDMLKQVRDFDLHLQREETSITESARVMAGLAKKYAQRRINETA